VWEAVGLGVSVGTGVGVGVRVLVGVVVNVAVMVGVGVSVRRRSPSRLGIWQAPRKIASQTMANTPVFARWGWKKA
jgi:hypothetical protein